MAEQQHIFIGGLHRSGTSLLHRLLAAHPDISGFHDTGVPEDEGQHLQMVYPAANKLGGPGKFALNPAAVMDECHRLAAPEHAKELQHQWKKYWDMSARYLLEKSPPNLIRGRFLQALFPGARLIFMVRHPVAVSLATQKWCDSSPQDLLHHWQAAYIRLEQDKTALDHAILLRYEDVVAHPQQVMDRLTTWLGLEPLSINEPVKQAINQHYFDQWQVQALDIVSDRAMERLLDAYGYQMSKPFISLKYEAFCDKGWKHDA